MIATFFKLKFLFGIFTNTKKKKEKRKKKKRIQRHENSFHGGERTVISK